MSESVLRFDAPAADFENALPLGAGKLGAMVYGGVSRDRISLNYDELWTGFPRDERRPNARAYYAQARTLVYGGRFKSAQRLIESRIASPNVQSYQPAGSLFIEKENGDFTEYERTLSLSEAVARVSYRKNGVKYRQTYFTSAPRDCLIIRFSADRAASVGFRLSFDSPLRFTAGHEDDVFFAEGECMFDSPQNREWYPKRNLRYAEKDAQRGVRFRTAVTVRAQGGKTAVSDDGVTVSGADSALIFCAIESSFAGFDRHPFTQGKEFRRAATAKVRAAAAEAYGALLKEHIEDHRRYYDRVSFSLAGTDRSDVPTPRRLIDFEKEKDDLGLYTLLFDFGRYLTVCGSRPGSEAMNLQGIWNEMVDPPWNADYTVNINTEMNYFPTLVCGLPEMQEPLDRMLRELSVSGRETARQYYGARGFCVHHNTDLWRATQPVRGRACWSFWPMAGGWLCRHMYEKYEYTQDLAYLRDAAYPVMKSAALFYLDVLTESPDGFLIFAPSTSPEHSYRYRGGTCDLSLTTTMTMSIINELFGNVLQAASILGDDDGDLKAIGAARKKLLPIRVGSDG